MAKVLGPLPKDCLHVDIRRMDCRVRLKVEVKETSGDSHLTDSTGCPKCSAKVEMKTMTFGSHRSHLEKEKARKDVPKMKRNAALTAWAVPHQAEYRVEQKWVHSVI